MSEHDFKGALEALCNPFAPLNDKQRWACEFALRLAEKVTQEPSKTMLEEVESLRKLNLSKTHHTSNEAIFKTMISQAIKEIEND